MTQLAGKVEMKRMARAFTRVEMKIHSSFISDNGRESPFAFFRSTSKFPNRRTGGRSKQEDANSGGNYFMGLLYLPGLVPFHGPFVIKLLR